MRFYDYMYEGIVDKALELPEPDVGGEYTDKYVNNIISQIKTALSKAEKQDYVDDDAKNAIISDLEDKLERWENLESSIKPETPPKQQDDKEEQQDQQDDKEEQQEEQPRNKEEDEKDVEDKNKEEEEKEEEELRKRNKERRDNLKKKNEERLIKTKIIGRNME